MGCLPHLRFARVPAVRTLGVDVRPLLPETSTAHTGQRPARRRGQARRWVRRGFPIQVPSHLSNEEERWWKRLAKEPTSDPRGTACSEGPSETSGRVTPHSAGAGFRFYCQVMRSSRPFNTETQTGATL